jgi:hypothetical protein
MVTPGRAPGIRPASGYPLRTSGCSLSWVSTLRQAARACITRAGWSGRRGSPAESGRLGRGWWHTRRDLTVQTAYLYDLHTQHLEPGQKPMQGGLIGQPAVQHRFHRFYGGDQVLEVKQGLWRDDSGDPDLVRRRCHPGPQSMGYSGARSPLSCGGPARRAPLMAGDCPGTGRVVSGRVTTALTGPECGPGRPAPGRRQAAGPPRRPG